jgi:hypothetical protein
MNYRSPCRNPQGDYVDQLTPTVTDTLFEQGEIPENVVALCTSLPSHLIPHLLTADRSTTRFRRRSQLSFRASLLLTIPVWSLSEVSSLVNSMAPSSGSLKRRVIPSSTTGERLPLPHLQCPRVELRVSVLDQQGLRYYFCQA